MVPRARERQTDRQTDVQTDKQTDRQTDRQGEKIVKQALRKEEGVHRETERQKKTNSRTI